MLGFVFGAGLFIILLAFLIIVLTYVWFAVALMTMAKNRNIEYAWLAFIPVGNLYIIGKLIGEFELFGYEYDNPQILLPAIAVISSSLTFIPVIGYLLGIVTFVVELIAIYQLIEMYKKGKGALISVFLVLLPPVGAYLLYDIRKNTPSNR